MEKYIWFHIYVKMNISSKIYRYLCVGISIKTVCIHTHNKLMIIVCDDSSTHIALSYHFGTM